MLITTILALRQSAIEIILLQKLLNRFQFACSRFGSGVDIKIYGPYTNS